MASKLVRTVHFQVSLKPSGNLSLVESIDGQLRIMRDGQLIPGCSWSVEELAESIQAYRAMVARLSQLRRDVPLETANGRLLGSASRSHWRVQRDC